MAKIFISTTTFGKCDPSPLEYCMKQNEVTVNPFGRKLTVAELLDLGREAEGMIAGTEIFDKQVLKKLPKLKVISRCGAGTDNIDLKITDQLGIKVFNTPDAPTLAVAELTASLILDLLRKVSLMDRKLREGIWRKYMGNLLRGKNIGIIGLGRIGKKVAQLLIPFGVKIAYFDIRTQQNNPAYIFKSMPDLLAWADIITLHCPAPLGGKRQLNKTELGQMKRGSYLINTSRGGLIDEEALYQCLKEGHLAAAALDVFEEEPYSGRLAGLENVILTPHIGSYAKETRIEMEKQAVENLLKGLEDIQ